MGKSPKLFCHAFFGTYSAKVRRISDSQELTEYENGFGDGFDFETCHKGEYWIGNKYLSRLSTKGVNLGIKLKRTDGEVAAVSYKGTRDSILNL